MPPDSWPTCRTAISCGTPPSAPENTNLVTTATQAILEFDYVKYECKDGYTLANVEVEVGTIVNTDSNFEYRITCTSENTFTNLNTADWPVCIQIENNRKKRYIAYEGLNPDIKYSMSVIFETQWMYTNDIEQDILDSAYNKSMDDPYFPKAVIDTFHDKIENTIGDGDMGEIQLKYPIYPTCEQPMTTTTPTGCVNTGRKYYCIVCIHKRIHYATSCN